MNKLVIQIAKKVQDSGGTAFLVGGCVRDELMGIEQKDFDIEVYGIESNKLRELLESFGKVDTVGKSFQVYKLNGIDVSIPRRERKIGKHHRDFVIEGDPNMSFEEACSRRDFTMNAILKNILTGELIDPYNGIKDIQHKIIRHVNSETFIEDSLRVLRAAQFSSRFLFTVDFDTMLLCRSMDLSNLSKERIWGELEKLLLSKDPVMGYCYLNALKINKKLFPQIKNLIRVKQDPIWHPEGDVWEHTWQVLAEARKLIDDLEYEEKIIVMLAALCHDFGKPATTQFIDGRWRAKGHEEEGVKPTLSFLDTIGMETEYIRNQVVAIVKNHLAPVTFYKDKASNSALRRLANKVNCKLLNIVSRADVLGRYVDGKPAFTTEAHDWFDEKIANLDIKEKGPEKFLMGRHLIQLGVSPGPMMGELLNTVYEKQLDGEVSSVSEAIEYAQYLLNQRNILP